MRTGAPFALAAPLRRALAAGLALARLAVADLAAARLVVARLAVARLALPAAAALLAAAADARADWAGFYRSSAPAATMAPPPAPPLALAAPGACVAEILRAQERHGIPGNILLGIGLQEAGVARHGGLTVWPWAVNAAGEGRLFESREAALDWVRTRRAAGLRSVDVGCMQINLHWHPGAFANPEQGFDPAANVDYAARFLRRLHDETGDWMRAAGAYHSRRPAQAEVYLASLRRNVAVANDRIDAFRAIAAGAGATAPPPAAAPPPPWEGGAWSVGQGDPRGAYGLYSRAALQPVLPAFLQDF